MINKTTEYKAAATNTSKQEYRNDCDEDETETETKQPYGRAAGDLSTLSMLKTRTRGDRSLVTNKRTE
jgi:hypothetical protein